MVPEGVQDLKIVPVRFLTVSSGHRIRLPRSMSSAVSWLSGETVQADALLGPFGGVQITQRGLRASSYRPAMIARLKNLGPTLDDVADPAVQLARVLATSWQLDCSFEPSTSRYTIVLPEEARSSGVVPNAGGIVAVFALGEIFEVWSKEDWIAHNRAALVKLKALGDELLSHAESD